MKGKKIGPASPLGKFILEYIAEHETTLTELSLSAGLSAGSLRQLVIQPGRRPSLETCMRLSDVTGWSIQEIIHLAGIDSGNAELSDISPDMRELEEIYRRLPSRLTVSLLKFARELRDFFDKEGGDPQP